MQHKLSITFHGPGVDGEKTIECQSGELVTQVAYRSGITIQQTCGGTPSCTDCRIKVLNKQEDAFEPMEGPESRLLGNVYYITGERLACQAILKNSCQIWVPDPASFRKEKILNKSPSRDRVDAGQKSPRLGEIPYGKKEKIIKKNDPKESQEKTEPQKEGLKKKH